MDYLIDISLRLVLSISVVIVLFIMDLTVDEGILKLPGRCIVYG